MPTTDKINLTPEVTTTGPFKGRTPLFELELNGIVTRTKKNSIAGRSCAIQRQYIAEK